MTWQKKWLFYVLTALLLMLFGSMTACFYPLHTWVDQNCFLTVAREWVQGRIPYRDLFEQKGPLLYLLHVPAALFPQGHFFGVWLVQVVCWSLLLHGMTRLCPREMSEYQRMLCAAWSGLVIVTAFCYGRGDNAEEYCLVPVVYSLGDLLHVAQGETCTLRRGMLLRNGLLAGVVLLIKFSMLGFYIGWCLVIGIWLWKDTGFLSACKAAAWFLLGMGLAILPFLVYFAAVGGLHAFCEVYFLANATRYPRKVRLWVRIADFFRKDLLWNPVMMALVLLGSGMTVKYRKKRISVALWVTLVLLYVFVFIGGVRYRYYLLILGAYVPVGVAELMTMTTSLRAKHALIWRRCTMAGYPLVLLLASNCLPYLGKPAASYPQVQFATIIEADSVLLNYGFLDGGFFLMSGARLPDSRFFCRLNIPREQLPEMYEEQERIILEGTADYAVIRKETNETWEERYTFAPFFETYELVDEATEPHDGYCYRLYRLRKEKL